MERFTLALMLCVVAFRNLIELSGSEFGSEEGFVLPKSFGWFRGNNVLWTISYVCLSSSHSFLSYGINEHLSVARFDRDGVRDARGLVQTRVYHQIQPYSTVSVRTIHRCPLSRPCKWKRVRSTRCTEGEHPGSSFRIGY